MGKIVKGQPLIRSIPFDQGKEIILSVDGRELGVIGGKILRIFVSKTGENFIGRKSKDIIDLVRSQK